ncbi:MAG: stage III sporulation protein AA [Acutalibacter sp.]|nr:stage III sporulation protein AA [Acutalibacter sp.]
MDTFPYDRLAEKIPLFGGSLLEVPEKIKEMAFDIRLKAGQPLSVCGREGIFYLREEGGVTRALTEDLLRVSPGEMQEIFLKICDHSVFSHEREIQKGYVLMDSHFRVGLCGTAVLETGKVKSFRDISTLVFRISREIQGCGDRLFLDGVDLSGGVLLVGAPSSGKTTLLRDITRSLSAGKFSPARRVAVLDERGEIEGDFDLGPSADVLKNCPKREAFDIALRMLSPEFLICDELSSDDLEDVRQSVFAGVPLIASIHGDREDVIRRPLCKSLLETGAFKTVITLTGRSHPGEIFRIERRTGDVNETVWGTVDHDERAVSGSAKVG